MYREKVEYTRVIGKKGVVGSESDQYILCTCVKLSKNKLNNDDDDDDENTSQNKP